MTLQSSYKRAIVAFGFNDYTGLLVYALASCRRPDLDLHLARDSVLSLGGLPRPRSATPGVESRVILHFKFVVWFFLKAFSVTTVKSWCCLHQLLPQSFPFDRPGSLPRSDPWR